MKPTHLTEIAWQEIAAAAMLGTQRKPFQPPELPAALAAAVQRIPMEGGAGSEADLLKILSVTALYRRTGQIPKTCGLPAIPTCPEDEQSRCPAQAGFRLEQILASGRLPLLAEWAGLAAQHQVRIREEHLPILLSHWKKILPLRAVLIPILGQRGRWLAAQNPEWSAFAPGGGEQAWHYGQRKERLAHLADLRAQNPQAARELLAAGWAQEAPQDRVVFLQALSTGLSEADEPFLESALDDRRKDVRQAAAALLRRLPESRLVQRMLSRAREQVAWKTGLLRSSIEIRAPERIDGSMARDGFEEKLPAGLPFGEKSWWLAQLVAFTPPQFWTARWNKRPAAILEAARKHEWENALIYGWKEAALAWNAEDWLDELTLYEARQGDPQRLYEWFTRLPDAKKDPIILALLHDSPYLSYDQAASIWLTACRFPWSRELTEQVTTTICSTLTRGDLQPWRWEVLLREIGMYFQPSSLHNAIERIAAAQAARDRKDPYAGELLTILSFRLEMHQAFQEVY